MRTALAALTLLGVIALSVGSAPAAQSACPYQGQVFIYGQNGWDTITNALAANQTPCVQYYVVLTAITGQNQIPADVDADLNVAKRVSCHQLAPFQRFHS